jgi:hypothetical protein
MQTFPQHVKISLYCTFHGGNPSVFNCKTGTEVFTYLPADVLGCAERPDWTLWALAAPFQGFMRAADMNDRRQLLLSFRAAGLVIRIGILLRFAGHRGCLVGGVLQLCHRGLQAFGDFLRRHLLRALHLISDLYCVYLRAICPPKHAQAEMSDRGPHFRQQTHKSDSLMSPQEPKMWENICWLAG